MKLKKYLEEIEELRFSIKGCDNLIDFYKSKKKYFEKILNEKLEKELD